VICPLLGHSPCLLDGGILGWISDCGLLLEGNGVGYRASAMGIRLRDEGEGLICIQAGKRDQALRRTSAAEGRHDRGLA
jgi:hypothetical protein